MKQSNRPRHMTYLLAAFSASMLGMRGSAAPPSQAPIEPPPITMSGPPQGVRFFSSPNRQVHMRAYWVADERQLLISSYHQSAAPTAKTAELYKVRYWPTCTNRLADGSLLVCGKGPRNGNTIIERWRFGPPVYPLAITTPGSPGIGAGPLLDVDEVYDQKVTGRDLVERIVPLWGSTHERALAMFADSDDVYSIDLESGGLLLIASPLVKPDSVHAPILSRVDTAWSRELVSGAYVYAFEDKDVSDGATPYLFVLYDNNKDGIIDANAVLTKTTFDALGYGSAASWVP